MATSNVTSSLRTAPKGRDSSASTAMKSNGYHHGELPETLMNLALEHIERDGTEKLSLRALAREAGVSPTAPYRHFASKQCLLAAIATQGFQALSDSHAALSKQNLPLEEHAIAMASTYIQFAQENPTSYQIMFGGLLGDFSEYEMLTTAVASSYTEVYKLLQAIIDARGLDTDPAQLGGVLWSFLHGMSSLLIGGVNMGDENSRPMKSVMALKSDPEGALRLMFEQLLGAQPTR